MSGLTSNEKKVKELINNLRIQSLTDSEIKVMSEGFSKLGTTMADAVLALKALTLPIKSELKKEKITYGKRQAKKWSNNWDHKITRNL